MPSVQSCPVSSFLALAQAGKSNRVPRSYEKGIHSWHLARARISYDVEAEIFSWACGTGVNVKRMRYGFVIDQDRCIGCHACTVACKEEHQVPIGVFRTWVKHIEKGEFPNTSRHFGVMRCNHCDDSPCTEICPTSALYRRADGIVDFDNRNCIGCKACMQACPYDALYIDPNNNTAAKCNFCAHRVEKSLEPACVIVCPTQAILAGDLDNPRSRVSRVVATQKVSVRKPQKGTQPKLFYVGIEGDLLEPTRISRQDSYFAADRREGQADATANDGINLAGALAREVYDVPHPAPWGWKIAAYLWTKAIAAGALLVAAILLSFGGASATPLFNVVCPLMALIGLAATSGLLIFDLKRPDRFFYLITKPNFRSWLVIGTYFLLGYGALGAAWLLCGMLARLCTRRVAMVRRRIRGCQRMLFGVPLCPSEGSGLVAKSAFPVALAGAGLRCRLGDNIDCRHPDGCGPGNAQACSSDLFDFADRQSGYEHG